MRLCKCVRVRVRVCVCARMRLCNVCVCVSEELCCHVSLQVDVVCGEQLLERCRSLREVCSSVGQSALQVTDKHRHSGPDYRPP